MAETLRVEVMAADRVVWEGEALSVSARTVDGDIGILPNHAPLLAILEPSAAEVLSVDGKREIVAVGGGFISVAENRVSILSPFARLAREILLKEAERELAEAEKRLNQGEIDDETRRHHHRAKAQVAAAEKWQRQSTSVV